MSSTPVLPDGWRLVALDSVGSTNDEATRLADAGAPEGTVVWAREQTGGRGRRGRAWASPVGNLYTSTVLRPDCPAARAAELGFVSALAVADIVSPGRALSRAAWRSPPEGTKIVAAEARGPLQTASPAMATRPRPCGAAWASPRGTDTSRASSANTRLGRCVTP